MYNTPIQKRVIKHVNDPEGFNKTLRTTTFYEYEGGNWVFVKVEYQRMEKSETY